MPLPANHDQRPIWPHKLKSCTLIPAYDREFVRAEDAVNWFLRGFAFGATDYSIKFDIGGIHHTANTHRFASARDCLQGCKITFIFGKKLQKTHTITFNPNDLL